MTDVPPEEFEAAVEAVVAGDLTALGALLKTDPRLVRARSARDHKATLLHYVAANGVEDDRQRTPRNAVAVATALLDAGAEVDALAEMYGSLCTTMEMLVSSIHPARAGLQVALVEVLLEYGAAVNGPSDDGSPLMAALRAQHLDAAQALVRCGARIDDIVAAAALGLDHLVGEFLGAADAGQRGQALIAAATFGQHSTVRVLLDAGADPAVQDHQGFTALHWAAARGHVDVVDALIACGAPLESRNNYGGTVLGCVSWASTHGEPAVDHRPVIERLIAAGADARELARRDDGDAGPSEPTSPGTSAAR